MSAARTMNDEEVAEASTPRTCAPRPPPTRPRRRARRAHSRSASSASSESCVSIGSIAIEPHLWIPRSLRSPTMTLASSRGTSTRSMSPSGELDHALEIDEVAGERVLLEQLVGLLGLLGRRDDAQVNHAGDRTRSGRSTHLGQFLTPVRNIPCNTPVPSDPLHTFANACSPHSPTSRPAPRMGGERRASAPSPRRRPPRCRGSRPPASPGGDKVRARRRPDRRLRAPRGCPLGGPHDRRAPARDVSASGDRRPSPPPEAAAADAPAAAARCGGPPPPALHRPGRPHPVAPKRRTRTT